MSSVAEERWQTRITSLKQGICKIYETKDFYDVVFIVNQKEFKAHKLILAARCSEFARTLLGPNAFKEIIVDSESVTKAGFEMLLCFIYTDTLPDLASKSLILEAYAAANYYNMKALKDRCERSIDSWTISFDEVCELLNCTLGIPSIRDRCLTVIKNSACEVISSSGFLKLNLKPLRIILENGALDDVPVKERIIAIIEWGAASHRKPVDYSLVRDDFMRGKPTILSMLGFENLDSAAFNELAIVKYRNLLKPEEIVKFNEFYINRDQSVLPTW